MKIWYFGNTTLRNPYRLQAGLRVLTESSLHGKIKGKENESAFARLLDKHGVVNITRSLSSISKARLVTDGSDASDLGRKWRSALGKLGFIYPDGASAPLGPEFTITPNGQRLLDAGDNVQAVQEVMLRALAATFIPSPIEPAYGKDYETFAPIRYLLQLLLVLEQEGFDPFIARTEMALIVQFSQPRDIYKVIQEIKNLRERAKQGKLKKPDISKLLEAVAKKNGYKPNSLYDYQDTTFRYVKATGLFQSLGRGICLVPEKKGIAKKIAWDSFVPASALDYYKNLCGGAVLPTDNASSALEYVSDLQAIAKKRKIEVSIDKSKLKDAGDIANVRHHLERAISNSKEEEYAERQRSEWKEIVEYMRIISGVKRFGMNANGEVLTVPSSERPAYLEWVLWRAFLAIDSLVNKPFDARRFPIDQDFLPVNTAPGGGPDLFFEFKDFALVVEVTLTAGSRQEAAEGEPVRRHVADIVLEMRKRTKKPVYGLFIANQINSNTAETFRVGVWYAADDEKMKLSIIPMDLVSFSDFFEALFHSGKMDTRRVLNLLASCESIREKLEAPSWKQEIKNAIAAEVGSLLKAV